MWSLAPSVLPLQVEHGPAGPVTAYRIGPLAYVTDVKTLPPETKSALHGLDLLVLGCLREKLHSTHMNWDEAEAVITELQLKHTILVHSGYEVKYAEWGEGYHLM